MVAITDEEGAQLFVRNSRQYRWIGDLVAVEMQNRQNGTIALRVQELVGMPGCGKRSGFGFPITDDARDDKIRIVESSAEGMRQ